MNQGDERHGPPPLAVWHRAHGARFAGDREAETVLDYGDPAAEYACLQEGAGLFHDAERVALELRGEDRVRFLNGLLTCDVKGLDQGSGAYGFFTDLKGRVLSDAVVVALEECLHVEIAAGEACAAAVMAHLEKYLVADRVEIRRRREWVAVVLVGPAVAAAVGVVLPRDPWGGGVVDLAGLDLLVVRDSLRAADAWTAWVRAQDAAALADHLVEGCGLLPLGAQALEVVRVESGVPRFGTDFGADNLPQETGLQARAVSYDKGCYLGQEVVARLHYRGQPARRVCRLIVDGDQLPEPGPLLAEGREAGELTSVVRSPRYGRSVGLGMVQRRVEAGARLQTADGGDALVEDLDSADVPRETSLR